MTQAGDLCRSATGEEAPHQGLAKPLDEFPRLSGIDVYGSHLGMALYPSAYPYLSPGYDVGKYWRVMI